VVFDDSGGDFGEKQQFVLRVGYLEREKSEIAQIDPVTVNALGNTHILQYIQTNEE
jgi:hypothetical protein